MHASVWMWVFAFGIAIVVETTYHYAWYSALQGILPDDDPTGLPRKDFAFVPDGADLSIEWVVKIDGTLYIAATTESVVGSVIVERPWDELPPAGQKFFGDLAMEFS